MSFNPFIICNEFLYYWNFSNKFNLLGFIKVGLQESFQFEKGLLDFQDFIFFFAT